MRNEVIQILAHYFSEPGSGKDLCDAFGAIWKKGVRKYAASDKTHIVDTPKKFAMAGFYHGAIANILPIRASVVNVREDDDTDMDIDEPQSKPKPVFQNISKLHSFEFGTTNEMYDGILTKNYSGIGDGRLVSPPKRNETACLDAMIILPGGQEIKFDETTEAKYCIPQKLHVIKEKDSIHPGGEAEGISDESAMEDELSQGDTIPLEASGGVYKCTDERCIRQFSRKRDLIYHVNFGKCKILAKTTSTQNQVTGIYFDQFALSGFNHHKYGNIDVTTLDRLQEHKAPEGIGYLDDKEDKHFSIDYGVGHALPIPKSKSTFSSDVKNYLRQHFIKGAMTGIHSLSKVVAEDMQDAKDNFGQPIFTDKDYLEPNQIMSQFQSLAKVQKKKGLQGMNQESSLGDLHEIADTNHNDTEIMEAARNEVMAQFRQQAESAMEGLDNTKSHPIVFSKWNICQIAKDYQQHLGAGNSMVHGINIRSLRNIWKGLKLPGIPPNDKTDIGSTLQDYVNENCGCLYLT